MLSIALVAVIPASAAPAGPAVLGVTHTQHTADGDSAADAQVRDYLASAPLAENQHIMGFGALNPEPSPGVFDWQTLDRRVALMRRTNGEPVITLCCSPDWMKGGRAGVTDWTRLAEAPFEQHFADFAALAAAVARRYPDVTRFLVWNELKGFYDKGRNRWDIEAYTRLYNLVYAALKQVNPDIEVGGPYVVMDSWATDTSALGGSWGVVDPRATQAIEYWLRHKAGADFIVVDGTSATRDKGVLGGDVAATGKFADVTRWLRARTDLPVWWAEVYPEATDDKLPPDSPRRAALAMYALARMVDAGVATALLWQPQQDSSLHSVALWTDTAHAGGGRLLPLSEPFAWLARAAAARRPIHARWVCDTVVVDDGATGLAVNAVDGHVTYANRPW